MTPLISIVASVLLVSSATVGAIAEGAVDVVDSPSAGLMPRTSDVRDVFGDPIVASGRVSSGVVVRPALELIGMTDGQARSVRRVVDLFAVAALPLPALVVRHSDDVAVCGEHLGVHRRHETWSEVVVCTSGPRFERIVVHELAHAWAAFELTDANKTAFQELRGWDVWRDYDNVAWADNGTEQAAEVIAWGVHDVVAAIGIDHRGCADLAAGYRALTGADPAQGLTTICEGRAARVLR